MSASTSQDTLLRPPKFRDFARRTLLHEKINTCFKSATDAQVLKHCLGLSKFTYPDNSDLLTKLADQVVMFCIDTEHYTLNSDEMTELGIGVLRRQDALKVTSGRDLGEHGDNLMRKASFHQFRFKEHSHMRVANPNSRGPEGNRFGEERFVTFAEMRRILRKLFVQPVTDIPELRHLNCPVVILGHAADHDMGHLMGKDLDFDVGLLGTVVGIIDTQQVVRETQNWTNTRDKMGLDRLVSKLEFTHSDRHSAANDAARTFMAAVQLVIPADVFKHGCSRSMQKVADEYEQWTRETYVPLGGSEKYCARCGSVDHKEQTCIVMIKQPCAECTSRGLFILAKDHITKHCTVLRDEVAEERRKWYRASADAGQRPRELFVSHLKSFAPKARRKGAVSEQEIAERRVWYRGQDQSKKLVPFCFHGRSYEAAMCRKARLNANRF